MTFKLLDRTRMTISGTPGTGAITVNAATLGFLALSAGLSDGDTTAYLIEDGTPQGAVWEYGVGTWHSNGTFSRDTVTKSSLGGATLISVTPNAILSAACRAEDLNSQELTSLSDVLIVTPSEGEILRYNSATGNYENKGSVWPTQVAQVGAGVITSAGTLNVTMAFDPTPGNMLVGFAFGGGGYIGGSRLPATWDGWDYVYSPADASLTSYAFRAVRPGDVASLPTINLTSGQTFGVAGVFEMHALDLTRWGPHLRSLLSTTVATNPSSYTNEAPSIPGSVQLYACFGPNVSMTMTGPGVDLAGGSGSYGFVLGHDTATGYYNGAVTTINGTGDVSIQTMNVTGLVL
jgi:hypothetical protein